MLITPKSKNDKHSLSQVSDVPQDVVQAFKSIVDYLTSDPKLPKAEIENYADTPIRSLKGYMELCRPYSEILETVTECLETGFPVSNADCYGGMVTEGPIKAFSLCPHHLFLVEYDVYVSYLPSPEMVLGLSKLPRIVKALASRPTLQEQLTKDVANVLFHSSDHDMPSIATRGSAVQTVGRHGCVMCRGVKDQSKTSVTELRGGFWEPNMESKFYQAIQSLKD